ncbi:DUF1801 domain-containing protein [Hymenobacter sp.]|uniref:YdeI/OmpD-associated family protein n=1 Tax=Hymenobacter sp. TaxID=1898978 RepID=UPI00286CF969|nr:DUF1801 domain-containing protein [Hymenobacter sp.]
MNPKVDFYFHKARQWREELEHLRTMVLARGLTEELKWGVPCYTFENCNIVLLHTFKDYCALLFFKGALLKDSQGILVQQTEQVQAARQIRFRSVGEVAKLEPAVKAYLQEAIEAEKAGLKVELKKTADFGIPTELQDKLAGNEGLKTAFNALTPGRQRAYLLHFAQPKQSATRQARVEKWMPQIMSGKGLND